MTAQRWFAGLPVTSERHLDADDEIDRLGELISSVRTEGLVSYALVAIACLCVAIASSMNLITGWVGPAVLMLTMGTLRYLPQRRLFRPATLVNLGKDRAARMVYVCQSGEMTLEVLAHSHFVWTRDGVPVSPAVIAHGTATVAAPDHARLAANFVHPADDESDVLVHQRALDSEELRELESYAPRPSFALAVLAAVGIAGTIASYVLAVTGRLTTLAPAFLFVAVGGWAAWDVLKSHRAHRRIRADLEAGYVVIVRVKEGAELSDPTEVLPASMIIWTENGVAAEWRKHCGQYRQVE